MNFEFTHTCIRVFDLEKSIKFYEKALNLKINYRKKFSDFELVYLTDEGRKHEIELTYNFDTKEAYNIGNGYSHIAFYIEDIDKAHEYHKSLGYEVTDVKQLSKDVAKIYFITDPDGYKVELIQKKVN